MSVRAWLSLVGVLSALVILPALSAREGASEKVKKHLGEPILKVLAGADRVECFRIGSQQTSVAGRKTIDGYPIRASADERGPSFARKLAAALEDENSLFSPQARCFFPGVAFRVWKGKESVDVIVCYTCTGLRLAARDAAGKVVQRSDGGFLRNYAAWVKLAKEAFPNDPEIRKLNATGFRRDAVPLKRL